MRKQAELKIEILKSQKEDLELKVQRLQSQIEAIDRKIGNIQHFESKLKSED